MASSTSSRFERACGAAAFGVPFVVAVLHLASASVWRDDAALLRGLGWVGGARSGGISTLLVLASYFFPIGSLHFRASLFSALALGGAGYWLFVGTRRILACNADTPRLSAALATIAAFTTTLGAMGQREGTVAGGASVALLFALLVLAERPLEAFGDPRRSLGVGLVLGALAGESPLLAATLAIGVAVGLLVARVRPRRTAVAWALGGVIASLAFVWAPLYVRPWSPKTFLDLGQSFASLGSVPFEVSVRGLGGAGALRDDVGRVALALALAGGAIGVLRARLRAEIAPLVVVTLLDLLASSREGVLVGSEDLAGLHFVALSFLCVGVALAVQTTAVTLFDLRLVMAREATILLVMGDLAIVAASAEEASFSSDRSLRRGAEAFTDESVEGLPPGAAVLVRSRAVAERLWSLRAAFGSRPDVLVAPLPLLGDPRIALGVLRAEPALQQTMRDVALDGRPGEEALTILADARPTMVELDPRWDRRIISHLVADHLWLRFAPEPLGPSDRKAAFADLSTRFARVLVTSTFDERVDPSTASVLGSRMRDAVAEAAALGDRDEAIALLEELGKVSSGDRFVAELTQRLVATKSGPIDIKGLLR